MEGGKIRKRRHERGEDEEMVMMEFTLRGCCMGWNQEPKSSKRDTQETRLPSQWTLCVVPLECQREEAPVEDKDDQCRRRLQEERSATGTT